LPIVYLKHEGGMRVSMLLIAVAALVMVAAPMPRAIADDVDTCAEAASDQTIAACTRAINSGRLHDHDLAAEYYNRGIKYAAKGDYDRAIADYTEAIKLDPKYADAYGNRGNAYRDEHDLDHAFADYNEALQIRPGAIDYFNRGNAYYVKDDYDRAIADYSEAIKLDPGFARAYYNRGLARRAKGDSAGGDADIAMARQRAPH
jgi:tetratricopeptide (TPR) repeat protein